MNLYLHLTILHVIVHDSTCQLTMAAPWPRYDYE